MEWLELLVRIYVIFVGSQVSQDKNSGPDQGNCPRTFGMDGGSLRMASQKRVPYTIIIEGNVGCGKSTMVDILSKMDSRYEQMEIITKWVFEYILLHFKIYSIKQFIPRV